MKTRLTTFLLLAPFVFADPALGLAGGATGSGGGGGGGGGFSSSSSSYGSSGGSGGSVPAWATILIILFVVGPFVLPFLIGSWRGSLKKYGKAKIQRRSKKIEEAMVDANLGDGYWAPVDLRKRVRESFFPIQNSWERRDVSASRPFVSDSLYERHELQLDGLEKQNRVNRIQGLKLDEIQLVRIHNVTDDGEDRFVAYIACRARDWVEDTRTGQLVNGNKRSLSSFEQYWSYVRHPEHGWVLDEIQQREEGDYHLDAEIVNRDEGPSVHEQQDAPSSPS